MTAAFDEVPFIGRRAELARLVALLDDGPARLVTLTGRGGVGKTRIAREFAFSRQRSAGIPVTFVSFAGVRRNELIVPHLGAALGLPPSTADDPVESVIGHLGGDEHLFVLDNLEHLPGAARHVALLLDRCSGLRVLATSQAPLRLRNEHVLPVGPLAVTATASSDGDSPTADPPAVELYLAAARLADVSFTVTDAEHETVTELCRRLEGLPLALELAGARAATLRPAEVLRCLDEVGVDVLSRARVDAPARHHDVRAAIRWTRQLLTPSQHDLLSVLAVGQGSFALDTVMAVPGRRSEVSLDDLGALVDLHLVERTVEDMRGGYAIPDSIRDDVISAMEDAGTFDVHRRRYVAAWARIAHAAADQIEARWMPPAWKNDAGLSSALEIALETGQIDDALDLVRVLADGWDDRGYYSVHESLLERALAAGIEHDADPVRLARVATWSAMLGLRKRSTRPRGELLERLQRAEQLDDDDTRLFAASVRAMIAPVTGDYDGAAASTSQALELAAKPANARWLPSVQVWAGMVATQQGDVDRAIELGLAALRAGREAGDDNIVLNSVLLLGPHTVGRPDLASEVPSNTQALELARRCHQPLFEAIILTRLVAQAAASREQDRALEWAEEMLRLGRSMTGSPFVAFQLLETVWVLALHGDTTSAVRLFGVVRPALPVIERYDNPAHRHAREAQLAELRCLLGEQSFEETAARGASMTLVDAVEFALAAVRELRHLGADNHVDRDDHGPTTTLTPRQEEILQLLGKGLANKAIALQLGISAKTVMHHTVAIYRKLGVTTRQEAIAHAYRSGMITST